MKQTTIKTLLTVFAFFCSVQSVSLQQVENYLNSFKSFEGRFEQLTAGGELQKGTFKLLKPGKLRLNYEQPSNQIIFSNDNILYVYDYQTKDLTQIPIDQSLAEVLLSQFVIINDETFTINQFEETSHLLKLSLSKKENTDTGQLTLVFHKDPLRLIQWIILDIHDQKTVVNLYDVKTNTLNNLETCPAQIVM